MWMLARQDPFEIWDTCTLITGLAARILSASMQKRIDYVVEVPDVNLWLVLLHLFGLNSMG